MFCSLIVRQFYPSDSLVVHAFLASFIQDKWLFPEYRLLADFI